MRGDEVGEVGTGWERAGGLGGGVGSEQDGCCEGDVDGGGGGGAGYCGGALS